MFLNSIRKKCQLCSRLSYRLKGILSGLLFRNLDCRGVHRRTYDDTNRVKAINDLAPDCACESRSMSKYSPCIVSNHEVLARFVFSPIHCKKDGTIKPAAFSHVYEKGCSIQRDTIAQPAEILAFAKKCLEGRTDLVWVGVICAHCETVRSISIERSERRAVCVFDTAEPSNPAHAELCQTHYVIDEADRIELRRKLFSAFGNGKPIPASEYRAGSVWSD